MGHSVNLWATWHLAEPWGAAAVYAPGTDRSAGIPSTAKEKLGDPQRRVSDTFCSHWPSTKSPQILQTLNPVLDPLTSLKISCSFVFRVSAKRTKQAELLPVMKEFPWSSLIPAWCSVAFLVRTSFAITRRGTMENLETIERFDTILKDSLSSPSS